MLALLHGILLNGVRLCDQLRLDVLLRREPVAVGGKRPEHVLITGDGMVALEDLAMLVVWCRKEGIARLTLHFDYSAEQCDYLHQFDHVEVVTEEETRRADGSPGLTVRLARGDQLEAFADALRSRTFPLLVVPADPIDLIIVTGGELSLAGLPATSIGFAEVAHYPEKGRFVTDRMLQRSLCQYAACRQNYGK